MTHESSLQVRVLTGNDLAQLQSIGADVFDDAIVTAAAAEFLSDPRHHLVVAVDRGVVVGFVSSVHYIHPDKAAPELWINEVGVADGHRQRGIGKAIMQATLDLARTLGCTEAWVVTERSNEPAMRLYASSGGREGAPDQVVFSFDLTGEPS